MHFLHCCHVYRLSEAILLPSSPQESWVQQGPREWVVAGRAALCRARLGAGSGATGGCVSCSQVTSSCQCQVFSVEMGFWKHASVEHRAMFRDGNRLEWHGGSAPAGQGRQDPGQGQCVVLAGIRLPPMLPGCQMCCPWLLLCQQLGAEELLPGTHRTRGPLACAAPESGHRLSIGGRKGVATKCTFLELVVLGSWLVRTRGS